VITETQECNYEELPKEDAAKQLLAFVLETNSLEKYIGFSRCTRPGGKNNILFHFRPV
jgi:hypothetical protein